MDAATTHTVKIFNHYADQVVEVQVPEDRCGDSDTCLMHQHSTRYVLWEAEDQGLELPYACRMGCCTACAVKVVEGELYQPQVCVCVWITGIYCNRTPCCRRWGSARSSSSRGMRSCV